VPAAAGACEAPCFVMPVGNAGGRAPRARRGEWQPGVLKVTQCQWQHDHATGRRHDGACSPSRPTSVSSASSRGAIIMMARPGRHGPRPLRTCRRGGGGASVRCGHCHWQEGKRPSLVGFSKPPHRLRWRAPSGAAVTAPRRTPRGRGRRGCGPGFSTGSMPGRLSRPSRPGPQQKQEACARTMAPGP
jgi:hypothetical protein